MAISNKCQCSKNRIVTHTPRVNMYHIPFVNINHYSCQASSFRERELSRWSQTAFIESRFWRTNQTCDVCIPVHISYLLHSYWTVSYALNNLLAFFCNNDYIIFFVVNSDNLGYCPPHSPPTHKGFRPTNPCFGHGLQMLSFHSRWRNVLLDMLHKTKCFKINRDLAITGYNYALWAIKK